MISDKAYKISPSVGSLDQSLTHLDNIKLWLYACMYVHIYTFYLELHEEGDVEIQSGCNCSILIL